jgi:hypothetical protein
VSVSASASPRWLVGGRRICGFLDFCGAACVRAQLALLALALRFLHKSRPLRLHRFLLSYSNEGTFRARSRDRGKVDVFRNIF